LLWLYLGF